MILVAAGMIRSGSTWQFNCLRIILKQAGLNPVIYWVEDYKFVNDEVSLIKTHEYKPKLAGISGVKVFTAIRSEEGIKGSMRRRAEYLKDNPDSRFMGTANTNRYPRYLKWHRLWRGHAVYNMRYKDLKNHPELVVHEHIKALGLTGKVDPLEVLKELNEVKPPTEAGGWDKETFYHTMHITKK